jgi:hypothetical protein
MGMMVRHINDPIPSARALSPAVPPAVDELIAWAMAKKPADRPASAAEFGRLLRQAMERPNERLRPEVAPAAVAPAVTRTRRPYWLAAAVVAGLCLGGLLLLGGGGLAALLFESPTVIPTATRLPPTATIGALTPEPGVLLRDDFSDPDSGFATAADADGGVAYAQGQLRITALTAGVEWTSPSGRVAAEDVAIEVTARRVAGPPGGELMVMCRWRDANNHIAAALNGQGQVALRQEANGATLFLRDWSDVPPSFDLAEGLRLRLTCQGNTILLTANNVILAEATDNNPVAGDVALATRLDEPGEQIVTFDDLLVSQP